MVAWRFEDSALANDVGERPGLSEAPLPSVLWGGGNGTRNGAFLLALGWGIVRPASLCKSYPYCANFLLALPPAPAP